MLSMAGAGRINGLEDIPRIVAWRRLARAASARADARPDGVGSADVDVSV